MNLSYMLIFRPWAWEKKEVMTCSMRLLGQKKEFSKNRNQVQRSKKENTLKKKKKLHKWISLQNSGSQTGVILPSPENNRQGLEICWAVTAGEGLLMMSSW